MKKTAKKRTVSHKKVAKKKMTRKTTARRTLSKRAHTHATKGRRKMSSRKKFMMRSKGNSSWRSALSSR